MTDANDLISRKAAIDAATKISLRYGVAGEPAIMLEIKDAIRALPSVGVPETGEGKVCDRLNATQWAAITAHFSYECEPRTPLPNWNTVALEAIRLSNELRDARERLVATDVQHAPIPLANWRDPNQWAAAAEYLASQPAPDAAQVRAEALDGPESLAALAFHLRKMADGQIDAIDSDRLLRAAAMIDAPPAPLPDVAALVAALIDQNSLLRSAKAIADREGVAGEKDSTNWDAFYNRVSVSLKRHHQTVLAALAQKGGDA